MKPWLIHAFADEADSMIDGQIAAMKRNHIRGLEIRTVDGKSVADISIEKAKEVRKKLDDAGLVTWSIGSPIGKISIEDPFEPHIEKLKHVIEVANELAAERIRMFSFYIPQGEDAARYPSAVFDRMGMMLQTAHGSGVALCHENEKGIYGDIAVRCKELHDAFPELRGIFDPANFIQCGQETMGAWKLLKQHIDYLHIKDAQPDGAVVPAGKGVGHLREIIAEYFAMGGRAMTVEPHLKVFDGLKALEREGEKTQLGLYVYETNDQAFDAACDALQVLL